MGPALNHYRCVTCYFPCTRTTRVCKTVTFIPHEIPIPQVTLTDHLKQAATDIVTLLTNPPSSTTPSLRAGDPVQNALLDIAEQLKRVEPIPTTNPEDASPPRVPTLNKEVENAPLPRVEQTKLPTSSDFRERSNLQTRLQYHNQPTHQYDLRPRVT